MRISDWSSDVCSSDLSAKGIGMASTFLRSLVATAIGILVAFALILLAQYAGGELAPEAYDPATGEILIPVGATVALIVGWLVEIGRASCRERVCQYV